MSVKREFKLLGDVTELKINCKYGEFVIIFDTKFLPIIENKPWTLKKNNENQYYACYSDYSTYKTYKRIFMHRLIANTPSDRITDHINRNTLDNRECNLKVCTHRENMQNRCNNKSGKVGVHWHKKDKKWRAKITVNNKIKWLGSFDLLEDAISARVLAEKEYFKGGE